MTKNTRAFVSVRPIALTGLLVGALGVTAAPTAPPQAEPEHSIRAALQQAGIEPRRLGAEVIVAWNAVAHDLAFAEDQFLTFKGQRALAMMHLAMHDALNAIVPVYAGYAYAERRLAHPLAASTQAAHDVLAAQYPNQRTALADQLAGWLAQVPDGVRREQGIQLGHAAAAAVLAIRDGDNWNFPGTYEFTDQPGRYQTTPPWNGFVAQPGFRFARPFLLEYARQFQPPPPPPLRSKAYARAFSEVKTYGGVDSSRRTAEQTGYAIWWMEFAEGSVNRLARHLAIQHDLHLWRAARMFAHVGVALYDTYVATWDAKYRYDHWRPFTAIRAAETDDNPRTTADPNWEPLRVTPPFPEYTSAHAGACSASFRILRETFGGRTPFTMETTTAPPDMPTRTFASFDAAAAECADSRVRLGWHFRYATDSGLKLGRRVARYTLSQSLQPLHRQDGAKRE